MISELTPIVRQEYLYHIAEFCARLNQALCAQGLTPEKSIEIFQTCIFSECLNCSIRVSGDELFALSQPPSAERASAKIGRLRLGDCARQGCTGCYYRFYFTEFPNLDWQLALAQVDAPAQSEAKQSRMKRSQAFWIFHFRTFVRFCFATVILSLLFLARQLYQGGRIPLVREPEHFRVDTTSEDER
jgi:hypothetical protein